MDPAGVVIVISVLKATGGKRQRSCQWGFRESEREKRAGFKVGKDG